ncbi:MAG: Yip1 family protein [Paracoccus sp. (in: a-proteobacteria)]|nr:Yip1 family protein [Paracoccus sp. (in: a-proteobacteria)]
MNGEFLRVLAVESFRNTPRALRMLQGLNLPMGALWSALVLAAALSTLASVIQARLIGLDAGTSLGQLMTSPLSMASIQLAGLSIGAWLWYMVGRMLGGTGQFSDALVVVAWIEFLLVAAQLVQMVLMLLFPFFSALVGLAAFAGFVYLVINFTKPMHGFVSTLKIFLVMFVTISVAVYLLSGLALALGLIEPPVAPA